MEESTHEAQRDAGAEPAARVGKQKVHGKPAQREISKREREIATAEMEVRRKQEREREKEGDTVIGVSEGVTSAATWRHAHVCILQSKAESGLTVGRDLGAFPLQHASPLAGHLTHGYTYMLLPFHTSTVLYVGRIIYWQALILSPGIFSNNKSSFISSFSFLSSVVFFTFIIGRHQHNTDSSSVSMQFSFDLHLIFYFCLKLA